MTRLAMTMQELRNQFDWQVLRLLIIYSRSDATTKKQKQWLFVFFGVKHLSLNITNPNEFGLIWR